MLRSNCLDCIHLGCFGLSVPEVVLGRRVGSMPFLISAILLVCVSLAFIPVCLKAVEYWTQHTNEPPVLGNSMPFITPLLGILRHRTNFMVQIR